MKSRRTRVAAYALLFDRDSILLCRLSARVPKLEGHWTLPGGGIEFGEDPKHAVVREVKEETGLDVVLDKILGVDSVIHDLEHEDMHALRLIYRARVTGGVLAHEASGTTDQCAWLPLENLKSSPVVDLVYKGIAMSAASDQ